MKRILVLAAVVVTLIAAVFVIHHREQEQARSDRAEARLLSFGDRQVEAIVMTVDGTDWRFEPVRRGWRVMEPVVDAASADAINELIAAANRVAVTRVIDDPEALSAYGLDPPAATVRFEGVGAVLHLGAVAPTGEGLFAAVDGRPGVLVLESTVLTVAALVQPDPHRLRDPEMFGIPRTNIAGIAASSRAGEVAVERRPDGWWITAPRVLPAADEQVDRLLDALEQAEIRGFDDRADPDSPELGLGPEAMRIDVNAGEATRRFVVGPQRGEGERLVTRDDRETVLVAHAPGFDDLSFDLQSVAARRLSRVNRYHVEGFSYRKGGESVTAKRTGDQWASEQGTPIPDEAVYELLARILEVPVAGWSGEGSAGGPPVAALRYSLEDGTEGLIEFLPANQARVSDVDGCFRLDGPPPAVPPLP
jgi:hypothetical protein